MWHKIVCRKGRCIDVGKARSIVQGDGIIRLIEKDFLENEIGDLYDDGGYE